MAEKAGETATWFPPQLLILLALVLGVVATQIPLESARPPDDRASVISARGLQTVPLRLWDDPFAAAPSASTKPAADAAATDDKGDRGDKGQKGASRVAPGADGQSETAREVRLENLASAIESAENLTVISALVSVSNLGGGKEARRRTRFAVVSALLDRGYISESADTVGLVFVPDDTGKRMAIPFEWFRKPGVAAVGASSEGLPPMSRVLVLWIPQEALFDCPVGKLRSLLAPILNGQARPAHSYVLGPANSSGLLDIEKEARRLGPCGSRNDTALMPSLTFYSSNATIPMAVDSARRALQERWQSSVRVIRTIGDDTLLAKALATELANRQIIGRGAGSPWEYTSPGVLLISEVDTDYSSNLKALVKSELEKHCAHPGCVREATYLRGLDGDVRTGPASEEKKEAAESTTSRLFSRQITSNQEKAQGTAQYDYLRRILPQLDIYLNNVHGRDLDVGAIGVLGSDFFDKLVVLRAFRSAFPKAVFFTNDLDARVFHAEEIRSTKNLLVASHFGLALADDAKIVAPFRDSYQTSVYLALSTLLSNVLYPTSPPETTQVWEESFSCFGRGGTSDAVQQASLFEIGRTRPVLLNGMTDCPSAEFSNASRDVVSVFHKYSDQLSWMSVRAFFFKHWLSASAGLLFISLGVILLYVSASRFRMWLRKIYAPSQPSIGIGAFIGPSLLFVIMVVLMLALAYEWVVGIGEPISLRDGVSMWPVEFLRVAAIAFGVLFVLHMIRRCEELCLECAKFGLTLVDLNKPSDAQDTNVWARFRAFRWYKDPRDRATLAMIDGKYLDAADRLERFQSLLSPKQFAGWMVLYASIVMAIGVMAFALLDDRYYAPTRGPTLSWLDPTLFWGNAAVSAAVIAAVLFFQLACTSFTLDLEEHPSRWPGTAFDRACERLGLQREGLSETFEEDRKLDPNSAQNQPIHEWIDFEITKLITGVFSPFIYFPFLLFIFAIAIRSNSFDSQNFPTSVLIVSLILLAYALVAARGLRRSAEAIRKKSLKRCDVALNLATHAAAFRSADHWRSSRLSAEEITHLSSLIRDYRGGAFGSYADQPLVRALLIAAGGFGGISALEWLSMLGI